MVRHVRARGKVGATRQGQQWLWSVAESSQIITSNGMDGSPLRHGEHEAFHHPPFIIPTWSNSTPKNITAAPSA